MTEQATEAPTTPSSEVVRAPLSDLAGTSAVSFESLRDDAAVVLGFSLTDKNSLLGHPFIITAVTFRYAGIRKGQGPRDYVSCEAVDKLNAAVVFNDGSTGVRRQIVQYLKSRGLLADDWDDDAPLVTMPEQDGVTFDKSLGFVPLFAPRGLRVSEYSNEYTDEGVTYYLG